MMPDLRQRGHRSQVLDRVPNSLVAEPSLALEIPDHEIRQAVPLDDKYQRVHSVVSLFSERILDALRREDIAVDLWYVVIPDVIYEYCRPQSNVAAELRVKARQRLGPRFARRLGREPSLFPEGRARRRLPVQH